MYYLKKLMFGYSLFKLLLIYLFLIFKTLALNTISADSNSSERSDSENNLHFTANWEKQGYQLYMTVCFW